MSTSSKSDTLNIRFAGIGGTGVIKASDILADVAFRCGHTVKKAEVHGMSQRGGSVQSDVRFGTEVNSPMIPEGACDFLVVMEPSQVEVVRGGLKPTGVLFTPEKINTDKLPSTKSLNVAMLGLLSRKLDFPDTAWLDSLKLYFPEKLHAANENAFKLGQSSL